MIFYSYYLALFFSFFSLNFFNAMYSMSIDQQLEIALSQRTALTSLLTRNPESSSLADLRTHLNTTIHDLFVQGARDRRGFTGLLYAVNENNEPAVREYFNHPAILINAPSNAGHTALMRAVINRNIPLVHLLIEHHADVNSVTPRFWSALTYAVRNNDRAMADILLDAGALPPVIPGVPQPQRQESAASFISKLKSYASTLGNIGLISLLGNIAYNTDHVSSFAFRASLSAIIGGYASRMVLTLEHRLSLFLCHAPYFGSYFRARERRRNNDFAIQLTQQWLQARPWSHPQQ